MAHPVIVWPTWKTQRSQWLLRNTAPDEFAAEPELGDASAHVVITYAQTKLHKVVPTSGAFDESVEAPAEPDTHQPWSGRYRAGKLHRIVPTSGAFDENAEAPAEPDTDQPWRGHYRVTGLRRTTVSPGAFDDSVTPEPDTDQIWRGHYRVTRLGKTRVSNEAYDDSSTPPEPELGDASAHHVLGWRETRLRRVGFLGVGSPYVQIVISDDTGITLTEELTVTTTASGSRTRLFTLMGVGI